MVALFLLAGCLLVGQEEPQTRNVSQHIIVEVPIAERMSLLERDFDYLSDAVMQLHDELRTEVLDIKTELALIREILQRQNDQLQTWIVFIIGLIVAGDRAWAIYQRKSKK